MFTRNGVSNSHTSCHFDVSANILMRARIITRVCCWYLARVFPRAPACMAFCKKIITSHLNLTFTFSAGDARCPTAGSTCRRSMRSPVYYFTRCLGYWTWWTNYLNNRIKIRSMTVLINWRFTGRFTDAELRKQTFQFLWSIGDNWLYKGESVFRLLRHFHLSFFDSFRYRCGMIHLLYHLGVFRSHRRVPPAAKRHIAREQSIFDQDGRDPVVHDFLLGHSPIFSNFEFVVVFLGRSLSLS